MVLLLHYWSFLDGNWQKNPICVFLFVFLSKWSKVWCMAVLFHLTSTFPFLAFSPHLLGNIRFLSLPSSMLSMDLLVQGLKSKWISIDPHGFLFCLEGRGENESQYQSAEMLQACQQSAKYWQQLQRKLKIWYQTSTCVAHDNKHCFNRRPTRRFLSSNKSMLVSAYKTVWVWLNREPL